MTVAARAPSIDYVENGVTLAFAAPFRFAPATLAASRVLPGGAVVELRLGTDFTASGGDTDAGGTVLLAASVAGARLRIRRRTPRSQPMDYTPGDRFPAESHEAALDRQTLIAQEQDAAIADTSRRALQVPDGEAATPVPAQAARADRLLAFDAAGQPVATGFTAAQLGQVVAAVFLPIFTQLAALVLFLSSAFGAVARSVQDKLDETIDVGDFGVVGDGIVSDTAAMRRVAAYVNASPRGAAVRLGRRTIRLDGDVTFARAVTLVGDGVGISRFVAYANARLIFDGNRIEQPAFALDGFSVLTDGIHASSPLRFDYSPHVDGDLSQTVTLRDLLVGGRNATSGFQAGIELIDCPWPKLSNVVIRGDHGNAPARSRYGIRYTGKDGSPSFVQVRGYSLQDFIHCEGEMEGYVFDDLEAVSVQRGITVLDTTNGGQPRLVIRGSHINAEECCIRTVGIDLIHIDESNDLYGQGAAGTANEWTAVDITPTQASGPDNMLVCSANIRPTVNGDAAFAAVKTGVRIRGSAVSLEDYVVGGRFQGLSTGVLLDAGTNNVVISAEATFRNVVDPVVDHGAGNVRLPATVAGSSVITTDASGRSIILFGSRAQFSTVPIVVVCGGGGGGSVQESYSVAEGSMSTTGFLVLITNGAGLATGVTRRVNWIATGN